MASAYSFLAADLMTNAILAELPLNSVSFESRLNAAGSFSGQLALGDPRVAAIDPFSSTQPGRTALYVDIGGRLVWGGILWTRRFDSSTATMEIGAQEFWSYFARRIVFSNTILLAQDQLAVARALISGSQTLPGGNIGVQAGRAVYDAVVTAGSAVVTSASAAFTAADVGSWIGGAGIPAGTTIAGYTNATTITMSVPAVAMPLPAQVNGAAAVVLTIVPPGSSLAGSNIAVDVPYKDSDMKPISTVVETLASARGGFDFAVDVAYDANGLPAKTLALSYPRRGSSYLSGTGLVFDLPGNILHYTWPEDATRMGDSVRTNGVGYGGTQLFSAAAAAGLLDAGYPLLELGLQLRDQSSQDVLDRWTGAQLDALKNPLVQPVIDVDPGQDPVLGSYTVGDECRVRITDQRFAAGAQDSYWRIVGIRVVPQEGSHEMVTLSLTNPWTG